MTKKVEHIKYLGTSDVRIITGAEWEAAGVKGQATTRWDHMNGWTVPAADLSDEARTLLATDEAFSTFEGAEHGPRAMPSDIRKEWLMKDLMGGVRINAAGDRVTPDAAPATTPTPTLPTV